MGALSAVKLVLEIDGQGKVTGALKDVESGVAGVGKTTKTVETSIGTFAVTATTATEKMARDTAAAAGRMAQETQSATSRMSSGLAGLETAIKSVITAWATWEIFQKGKEATMFAANVEQADRALSVIANTMGRTSEEALKYRDSLRDLGITTNSSTNAVAQFIKAGLPLDGLNKLGRAAQGAAISYQMMTGEMISSSAALDKMIRALVTGNVTELHTLGINVMMRDTLRENRLATGEAATAVDTHKRHLLMFNEVLEKTEPLMMLYEKSMDLAAKQISSSKRPIEELKLALGNLFLPELTAGATSFYQTVSSGMKWVQRHSTELTAAKMVVKDFAEGLLYAVAIITAYTAAVIIATAATGGFAAGAGIFSSALVLLKTNLSLTGAEAVIAGSKVGVFGESVATASKVATVGLLSVKTILGVLSSFMLGWEIGKVLSDKFEIVRKAGVYMVHGLITGWDLASEAYERFKATVNPFGDEEKQQAQLQAITAKYAAIKKIRDEALAGTLADTVNSPGITTAKPYQNDQAAIAAGKTAEAARLKKEADAAATLAAEEAQKLAEKQAQYNKQLLDADANLKHQYMENSKRQEDAALKDRLAQLKYEMDMGLKTTQEYLDAKYDAEKSAYERELKAAQNQAHERFLAYEKISNDPGADKLLQTNAEKEWAKAVGEAAQAQAKLNAVIDQKPREDAKHIEAIQRFKDEQEIQALQAQGAALAATAAQNELKYIDLKKKGYADELIDLQRINDEQAMLSTQWTKDFQEQQTLKAMKLANEAAAAAMVGTDPQTGAITDATAHQLAIQRQAHDARLQMIQDEKDALTRAMMAQSITYQQYLDQTKQKDDEVTLARIKNAQAIGAISASYEKEKYDQLVGFAQKAFPKITSFQTAAALLTKKYAQEEDGLNEDGTKKYKTSAQGKMQMTADYTAFAGQALSDLAATTDTTTRAGFEQAKAYNLGAAIMSTASAIIGQLSGPDAWTPAAWARAAIAGVMGAVQIAKIASTSFGGGASAPNVSAGSFTGGSAGQGGSVGGSIGSQFTSVHDSQSLDRLREISQNTKDTSLAIGKVADGLTKVSDLFKEGSFLSMAGGALASSALPSSGGFFSTIKNAFSQSIRESIGLINLDIRSLALNSILPGLGALTSSIFGGRKSIEGQGIALGMTGGNVSAANYVDIKTSGGWFSSDKHSTQYSANADAQAAVQAAINSISSTINRSVVAMGTTIDMSMANLAQAKISTAGRKAEDINKDIQAWLENAANAMAKTVVGLKEFTFYGEDAFAALVRLSTALQSSNEKLELIGGTLIASTLAGANAAFKLQDMMGGVDAFTKAVDNYFTSMFTDTEQKAMKASQATHQVQVAFAEMGLTGITTRAQFIAVVNSLDITTERGAQLFAALMDISSAFATMTDAATESAKKLLSTATDTALNAANALKDILGGTLSNKSPEQIYQERQAAFADALAHGRNNEIPDLAKALLESSRLYNGSGSGYQMDFNAVTAALQSIAGMTGSPTLDAAERQVSLLTDIKTALDDSNNALLTSLAAQVDSTTLFSTALHAFISLVGGSGLNGIGGLPQFATGGVTNVPSIFGEAGWEAAVPLPDGRTIPVTINNRYADSGRSDNSEVVVELRAIRAEVAGVKRHSEAAVKVAQAASNKQTEISERIDARLLGIENKARLDANRQQANG